MPSAFRSPKSLPDWIELDYYRRPRSLRRLRWTLTCAILLGGSVLLALTFLPRMQTVYQAGPLSQAHTYIVRQQESETKGCLECHTQAFQAVQRLWPGNADVHSVTDDACKKCHDGAVHNDQQVHEPSCASCHQEHRGRLLLTQVTDGHCTACHANLWRKDWRPAQFLNVTDFARDHPEFGLWRTAEATDPGQLHFNHHVHLQEAGVLLPDGSRQKLECSACHQLDSARRYFQPINYEQHCARCHWSSLSIQVAGEWKGEQIRPAVERFRKLPAPHKAPAVIRAELRERYTSFQKEFPQVIGTEVVRQPGRWLPGHPAPGDARKRQQAWVDRQLEEAQRLLFDGAGGCRYCHLKKAQPTSATGLPEFLLTSIPRRWLPHSRFDHDSHRNLSCASCHAAAGSQQTRDVLMPRIGSCRECHNPRVGARSDCIECHLYHDRGKERGWGEGK